MFTATLFGFFNSFEYKIELYLDVLADLTHIGS